MSTKRSPITTEEVDVTPKLAAGWLLLNHNPRKLTDYNVNKFVQIINSGEWQCTHQGIAFNTDGQLVDGQHRLAAIVKAGKPCRMLVSRGITEDAVKVVDCGKMRKSYERLHIVDDDRLNRIIIQAVTRYIYLAVRDQDVITVDMIEDQFLARATSWEWVARQSPTKTSVAKRATVHAAMAIFHSIDPAAAERFFDHLITGAELGIGNPILALRNSLEGLAATSPANYWRTVAAQQAVIEGRRVTRLYEASEDLAGNANTARVLSKRAEKSAKGHVKRKESAA